MAQDPTSGDLIPPDQPVDITVSTGKPDVTVPFVIGDNKDDARQKLEDAGLRVKLVKQESDQEKDTVVSTDPNAATSVSSGSLVTVYYAAGPKEVPSVVGMQQDQATRKLKKAGFGVDVVYDSSTPAQKGQVLKQSPEAYTSQPKGTTVVITVSSYEEPTPTPTPTPTSTPTDQSSPSLPTPPATSPSP
jgi:serine/threonine-protein kinase